MEANNFLWAKLRDLKNQNSAVAKRLCEFEGKTFRRGVLISTNVSHRVFAHFNFFIVFSCRFYKTHFVDYTRAAFSEDSNDSGGRRIHLDRWKGYLTPIPYHGTEIGASSFMPIPVLEIKRLIPHAILNNK